MKPWLYNGSPVISADELPPKTVGFIYIITQLSTGRWIFEGFKLLLSSSEPADHDFAVTLGLAWTETGRKRKRSAQPVPV